MRKPEVAFVSEHCCIRVVKQASVLQKLGYNVHLIAHEPNSVGMFHQVHYYRDPVTLYRTVSSLTKVIDIWQVHNEPTWPVSMVRNAIGDSGKLLLDYHDSNYWRIDKDDYPEDLKSLLEDPSWYSEDVACQQVNGFVVPSEPCATEVATRSSKKSVVIPSACPESEFRYIESQFMGGLVSQGGHALPETQNLWRSYSQLFTELKGKKRVYAYCPDFTYDPNNELDKHYIETGATLGKFPYDELVDTIGRHSWNLVGNLIKVPVWRYALPNKFFDAIAAGIPSVNFGCPEVAKIIDKYDIGMNVATTQELLDRWGEHKQKRSNLWRVRHELCIDKYIDRLTNFYEEVLSEN